MKLEVLYEDNHLIAVEKPAGVLTQGDESGEKSLLEYVKEYLKEKHKKEGNVFLGLLHRLDRNVSGVVLFAKTSKGASRLSEQFRNHTVRKIYHALVEGTLKDKKGILKNYLIKDEIKNKTSVYDKEIAGSQYAELSYEILETKHSVFGVGEASLVKIELKTGRSHQIRAQFSYIGHPIIGDVKYGASGALPDQSIKLSAVELHFETATGTSPVSITSRPLLQEG
ncbi:MAG: RluA family pseudouridine synthase [Candidatus Taylorbacteria bacterium]|nr:RluA family pseudouridine synthase [Candidatus Taylorbacteria bacterium]